MSPRIQLSVAVLAVALVLAVGLVLGRVLFRGDPASHALERDAGSTTTSGGTSNGEHVPDVPRHGAPGTSGVGEPTGRDDRPHTVDPFAASPDVGDRPRENPYTPEFFERLLVAASANGAGDWKVACDRWSWTIPLSLAPDATEADLTVGLTNVAEACSQGPNRSPHDMLLAQEALQRAGQDEFEGAMGLTYFLERHPRERGKRAAFLYAGTHPEGTTVALDGEPACTEPCTVAVPVDGDPHRVVFTGPDGKTASLTWTPATPEAPSPALPDLE